MNFDGRIGRQLVLTREMLDGDAIQAHADQVRALTLAPGQFDLLPPELAAFHDVLYLTLSGNYIEDLTTNAPSFFMNLVALNYSNSGLKRFPTLPMGRLQGLDLSNNQISEIPHDARGLHSLRELRLHKNRITSLPSTLNLAGLREGVEPSPFARGGLYVHDNPLPQELAKRAAQDQPRATLDVLDYIASVKEIHAADTVVVAAGRDVEVSKTPPPIPTAPPAPIRTRVRDGRVVLDDLRQPPSSANEEDVALNWEELKKDAEALDEKIQSNAPGLSRRLENYRTALGESAGAFNEIRLGLCGEALARAVESAEEFLIGDTLGELRGLVANHYIFMQHFPRWLDYRDPAVVSQFSEELIEQARPTLEEILARISQEMELIDAEVLSALKWLKELADELGATARAAWLGVYRAVNEFVHSLARLAVKFLKDIGTKSMDIGSTAAAKFIVYGIGYELLQLTGLWPKLFDWVEPVIQYLKASGH